MCGIIGGTNIEQEALERGLDCFAYRGPDARGTHIDGTCSLGQVRLSIIDLDTRANQPFWSADQMHAIVFNGEIYNYKELRSELSALGALFRTDSDTEVLLEAYRAWGVDALPRLRGMFAFAIYDMRAQHIFLARDHAGIKPLYYSLMNGFSFASELKGVVSLVRSRGGKVSVREEMLEVYTAFGYVPGTDTLVQGVQRVARGSWLSFDIATGTLEQGRWDVPETTITTSAGLQDAVRASVLEHTMADVPVGLFFSGGIDSSVLALTLKQAGQQLETFSLSVEGRDADAPFFTAIAKHLDIRAHTAHFGISEAESVWEHVFSRMDDPIADTSILPTAFLSRFAAERVKVVLSGEGGDELFQGYPRQEAIAHMSSARHIHLIDSLLMHTPDFRGKRRIFLNAARAVQDAGFYYLLSTSLAQDRLSSRAWNEARHVLASKHPLWFDRDLYLEHMLLRKADMATMYASIEGRVPLLDARLWNAAPRFVRENLQGGTKMILRDMLREALPPELIDRPKSGFGISTRRLFEESTLARQAGMDALAWARAHELVSGTDEMLFVQYPALVFGLVSLHRSLKNIGCV